MAKKSKTQRAKASAARAAKKTRAVETSESSIEAIQSNSGSQTEIKHASADRKAEREKAKQARIEAKKAEKAAKKAHKKPSFFAEVRAELKRVTWPTKQDVLRWSGVVVVSLIFFSVFVLILDNLIVTPLLFAISSLGA